MLGTLVKMHCLSFLQNNIYIYTYNIYTYYTYIYIPMFHFFCNVFSHVQWFFQVFASTPAWFCGTVQAALGGARGLGHLAVSDFAIDEVATLLWEENDPRRKQEARFFQQNDPDFDGKIRRKISGTTFSSCFLDAFDRTWRFEWKKHNWYIMNHNPANMIINGGF